MWIFGTLVVAVLNVFFPPTKALGPVAGFPPLHHDPIFGLNSEQTPHRS